MHPRALSRSLVVLAALITSSLVAQAPAGRWSGTIDLAVRKLEIRVTLNLADSGWQGRIDIPAQGAEGLPLERITVDGADVSFAIQGVPGDPTFSGELAADGAAISGKFTQGGGSFTFELVPAATISMDGLQEFVDELRAEFHVPGCAVAVVSGGEIVGLIASGQRDVDAGLPVTPDTLFAIGSTTKAFTTLVLGTLVDADRLAWDRPVREWMPEFTLADPDVSAHITPRDLVTHRSGMPRHDLVWYGAEFDRGDMVRRLRYLPLSHDLRSDFQYNNLMFLTAGHLAERITGTTWENLVRDRIFQPLGMQRSNFRVAISADDPDHAEPYRRQDGTTRHIPFRDLAAVGPAGSINSSIRELSAWVSLHLQKGRHGDREIVTPSTMADLHRVRMPVGPDSSEAEIVGVGYALGWLVDVYRGARRIQHGGNIDGFSAQVTLLPEQGDGFVVLTNLDSTALPEMIVRRLCDRALGLSEKDWARDVLARVAASESVLASGRRDEALDRKPDTAPSHPLDDYAGDYAHPGYGTCRVERVGETLRVDFHGLAATLQHWHYDVFRCGEDVANPALEGTKIQFTTDFDGDIDGLRAVLEPAVEAIVFARQPDAELRDPEFLDRLCGEYELAGRIVTVARRGDRLTLALPGQFHLLDPRRARLFAIADLTGYSVRFLFDADGKLTGCRFVQPEGVFEAKRKPTK